MKPIKNKERISRIMTEACIEEGIPVKELYSGDQHRPIVNLRHAIIYCLVNNVGLSQLQTSWMIPCNSHTVIHALKKVKEEQDVYKLNNYKGERTQIIDRIEYLFMNISYEGTSTQICNYF